MATQKPKFNPNDAYSAVGVTEVKPKFDPNKPFEQQQGVPVGGDRFAGLDFNAPKELSFTEKAAKSWNSSWGSLAESVGAGMEWIGNENDAASVSDIGKDLQKWGVDKQIENYQEISKDIQDFNVEDMAKADWWSQKATTIVPSVLSLMAPSVAAYAAGTAATGAALSPLLPAALAEPTPFGEMALGIASAAGGAVSASAVSRT